MKEKLIELLNKYFNVGDSDFYVCNRVKEAFTLGTMSLDDFSEVDEENTSDIADYLLANGVIVPPCKVGDTVYFTKAHFGFLPTPKAEKIRKIELYDIDVIFRTESRAFNDKAIGSTVFLTKEEAEKALKGGAE